MLALVVSMLASQRPASLSAPRANPFAPTAAGALHVRGDARFVAWPALNDPDALARVGAGSRHRLHLWRPRAGSPPVADDPTARLFDGDALLARFGRALARRKAVDRKEFFEACEFFAQVRSKLKADGALVAPREEGARSGARRAAGTLVDCAGGHGLVGALAAMLKFRDFERVVVRDRRRPAAFDAVVDAAVEAAPWVAGRLAYEEGVLGPKGPPLPAGCAVACVHGCNTLTDVVIAAAAAADARSVALMPCCYQQTSAEAPRALRRALGVDVAADVHRTYALEALGYSVSWRAIPRSITPMNRILLAHRPARDAGETAPGAPARDEPAP